MMKLPLAAAILCAGLGQAAAATMAYYEGAASGASLRHFAGDIQILAADRFGVDASGAISGSIPRAVLALAASHGIQVLSTVSNFGAHGFSAAIAHAVLTPGAVQDKALAGMLDAARQTAGVNLDFENVHRTDRALYTAFVKRLTAALHAGGRIAVLSVPAETKDDPGDSWTGAYDYAVLGAAADLMQVMTYDENGPWSAPGPVAGLDWVSACLAFSQSVIPAAKISLGIPAYGYDWNLSAGTGVQVAYKAVPGLLQRTGGTAEWDAASSSPWFTYTAADGASHVVWYENARSIALKSALASTAMIEGTSIYALGFDDASFWRAIGTR